MTLSDEQELLRWVEELVGRRATTDRRMGTAWMLVPLLPIILAIVLVTTLVRSVTPIIANLQGLQTNAASSTLVGALLGFYAFAAMSVYVLLFLLSLALYYLIDRRNSHFKRQQRLFKALVKYLQVSAKAADLHASRFAELIEDSADEEQERPAGIWAILNLFAAPIVSLVVAFNLTQDLCRHDARQINFQETLSKAFTDVGLASPSPVSPKPLRRDTVLFLLLTVITAGLFWIYWFHILLKDYNEHFANQAVYEDGVLAALKHTSQYGKCVGCGGSVPSGARYCPSCGQPQAG